MSEISATLTSSMPSIASKLHVGVSHAMNCDWPQPSEDASKILVVVNNVWCLVSIFFVGSGLDKHVLDKPDPER